MRLFSHRCRRRGARWLVLLGVLFQPASAARAQLEEVPEPSRGQWASTTLALLKYNRDLCDGIAGKVMQKWSTLGGTPEQQEQQVREFVVHEKLSDMAAGRATADIIHRFLKRAREEVGTETAAALERLEQEITTLCNTVALPSAPRESFEQALDEVLGRIEREEGELGRLLVVPDEVLEAVLEPYLIPIRMVGLDAEGEFLDYLESLRPPPRQPTAQELMDAWHSRRYSPAVRTTKVALGKYIRGRQGNDFRAQATACREISAAVIQLLRHEDVFKSPDPAVFEPLRRAFIELRLMASQCTAGRSREVEEHYQEMQKHLGRAAGVLGKYSLSP